MRKRLIRVVAVLVGMLCVGALPGGALAAPALPLGLGVCTAAPIITGENTTSSPEPAGCTDPGATVTGYLVTGQGTIGEATVAPDGTITYVPGAGQSGSDTFTYEADFSDGTAATQTVPVTVTAGPTCTGASVSTAANNAVATGTPNCTDPLSGAMTYHVVAGPSNGTAVPDSTGQYVYTPAAGFTGTDAFSYTATAADGTSNPATVTVSVAPPAPSAQSGSTPGPPTAAIASPVANASYFWSSVPPAAFSCGAGAGTALSSCVARVDGTAISNGQTVPDAIGSHTMTVTATDADGQTATTTLTYVASLRVAPPVSITRPGEGARYRLMQAVAADYACLAPSHGPALRSCTGPVATGRPINTRTLGRHAFSVTAVDTSGQSTNETVTYLVVPTTNRFRTGRVRVDRHGVARLVVTLPGPGRLALLATAASTAPSAPAPRFVYARTRRSVNRAGRLALVVRPDARGSALLRRPGATPVIALRITYTPTGGRARVVQPRALRVP